MSSVLEAIRTNRSRPKWLTEAAEYESRAVKELQEGMDRKVGPEQLEDLIEKAEFARAWASDCYSAWVNGETPESLKER